MLPLQVKVDLGAMAMKEVFCISGTLPSDCLVPYARHSLWVGVLFFLREAGGVFYSPSRLDILQHRFWLVHIEFSYMDKFQFLK